MKLLASLTSPYARKIRVVLAEKGLPYELVVDSPWEHNTRVPEINPLGKVPVLCCDDGAVFFDSPIIAEYLDIVAPEPPLLPTDRLASVRCRQIEALADGLTDAAVTALLESRRPAAQQGADVIARQLEKINRALTMLEAQAEAGEWLFGHRYTLADIAAGCALFYLDLRFSHIGWRTGHPALAALAARLAERPGFANSHPPA